MNNFICAVLMVLAILVGAGVGGIDQLGQCVHWWTPTDSARLFYYGIG